MSVLEGVYPKPRSIYGLTFLDTSLHGIVMKALHHRTRKGLCLKCGSCEVRLNSPTSPWPMTRLRKLPTIGSGFCFTSFCSYLGQEMVNKGRAVRCESWTNLAKLWWPRILQLNNRGDDHHPATQVPKQAEEQAVGELSTHANHPSFWDSSDFYQLLNIAESNTIWQQPEF